MNISKIILIVICIFVCLPPLHAAEVANENVRQVGNRVLFEFEVTGEPNEDAEVNLTLTIKGKTYPADKLHLEGDFGKTKAGKGKKIYWNVLQDFPKGLSTRVEWDLSAGGGRLVKDPVTGMELVFVKGGCYQMGDTFGDGESDEKPVHEVCVDDFYIGKYEVTVGEFRKFVNETGYRTDAEKEGWGYTLNADGNKWEKDKRSQLEKSGIFADRQTPCSAYIME